MKSDLEAEASRLLTEWATREGVSLRSVGILNDDRLALIARREVPLFLVEADRWQMRRVRKEREDPDA